MRTCTGHRQEHQRPRPKRGARCARPEGKSSLLPIVIHDRHVRQAVTRTSLLALGTGKFWVEGCLSHSSAWDQSRTSREVQRSGRSGLPDSRPSGNRLTGQLDTSGRIRSRGSLAPVFDGHAGMSCWKRRRGNTRRHRGRRSGPGIRFRSFFMSCNGIGAKVCATQTSSRAWQ